MKASLTVLLLLACSPPRQADPVEERASLVLLRETVDPSDPDNPDAIQRVVTCGATAIGQTVAVTASHCVTGQTSVLVVDHDQWWNTGSGFSVATVTDSDLYIAHIALPKYAPAWVSIGTPSVADATLVRRFSGETVALEQNYMLNGVQLEHGDSGSGVFQNGNLVAVLQACASSDDVNCDLPGGRASAAPQQ